MSQENFTKGNALFKYTFDETARQIPFQVTIRNAFIEGFTCFEFHVNMRGKQYMARAGLRPELHNEKDAMDFAEEIWGEFESIVAENLKP
jgi:hypothetical protein